MKHLAVMTITILALSIFGGIALAQHYDDWTDFYYREIRNDENALK